MRLFPQIVVAKASEAPDNNNMIDLDLIWCERYRPNSLSELVVPKDTFYQLQLYGEKETIPNLILVGTPGIGKSSMAKIIVKDILKCDYLYINASDESGIDTIRTKVIGFAQTKSMSGGIKVVILDEACGITCDAQRALRNVMEEYATNTRFIITANYIHKIIPALQSRCMALSFNYDIQDVVKRCVYILNKENIKLPDDQRVKLIELIRSTFPDIRKIINYLQKYSVNGVLCIDNFSLVNTFITEVWNGIKDLDLMSLRKYIISNESSFQADYHMLLKAILNKLYDCDINVGKKREGILIISEYMYRHSFVIDTEINAYAALISLQNCLYS